MEVTSARLIAALRLGCGAAGGEERGWVKAGHLVMPAWHRRLGAGGPFQACAYRKKVADACKVSCGAQKASLCLPTSGQTPEPTFPRTVLSWKSRRA